MKDLVPSTMTITFQSYHSDILPEVLKGGNEMKITMTIKAKSVIDLQNTVLQLADFCSLSEPNTESTASFMRGEDTPEMSSEMQTREEKPGKEPRKSAAYDISSQADSAAPVEPTFTQEQVRGKMAALSTERVRELLQEFGVKRLSDINPNDYPALMEKAQ